MFGGEVMNDDEKLWQFGICYRYDLHLHSHVV